MSLANWGIALMVLMGIAIIANLVVIVRFFKKRRHTKFFNQAYLNLAVADLLLAAFGLSFRGRGMIYGTESRLWCEIECNLSYMLTYSDLLAICGITVDRFIASFFPFSYKKRSHKSALIAVILFAWIYPVFHLCAAHFILRKPIAKYNPSKSICIFSPETYFSWIGYLTELITKFLPLLFNTITYSYIIYKLRNKKKLSLSNAISSLKSILICVFFTVSWVPSWVNDNFNNSWAFNDITLSRLFQISYYMNCLLDPLIYSISTRTYAKMLSNRVYRISRFSTRRRRGVVTQGTETRSAVARTHHVTTTTRTNAVEGRR